HRAPRGRGPRRVPLRGRGPQRFRQRHRGHLERPRQRGGAHAAPGTRDRGGLRSRHERGHAQRHRRAHPLHQRDPARPAVSVTAATTRAGLTPRRFYRVVAIAEAITWTMLIVGLLLKYVVAPGEVGDLAVRIGGTIHGFVFITYAAAAVIVGLNQRWGIPLIGLGVLTAIVPYATIPFDHWLERHGRLEGGWRTEATDDRR